MESASSTSSTGGDETMTGEGYCAGWSTINGDVWLEVPGDKEVMKGIECLEGTLYALGTVGDLSGLDTLQLISGGLVFANDGPLIDAKGLSALRRIQGPMSVVIDSGLQDFSGLEGLESIGGIIVQTGVKSFNGLEGVTEVSNIFIGQPYVQGVPSFVSAKGLGDLSKLENLTIYGTSLSSLDGFEQIETITGDLTVIGNSSLLTCSAKALAEKVSPKTVSIVDNLADKCGS